LRFVTFLRLHSARWILDPKAGGREMGGGGSAERGGGADISAAGTSPCDGFMDSGRRRRSAGGVGKRVSGSGVAA